MMSADFATIPRNGTPRRPPPQAFTMQSAKTRDSCSDTDSGICADSDGQLSPKRQESGRQQGFPPKPPAYPLLYPPISGPTVPRRPSQAPRKAPALPVKPATPRSALKVRFADQVQPGQTVSCESKPEKPYYYSIPDREPVRSVAAPPPYEAAVERLQQLTVQGKGLRGSRNRSRSVGRLNDGYEEKSYARMVRKQTDDYMNILNAAKSVDNLANMDDMERLKKRPPPPPHPCVMPSGSCDHIVQLGSEFVDSNARNISPPKGAPFPSVSKLKRNHGVKKSRSEQVVRFVEPPAVKTDRDVQPLPSFYSQNRLHGLQSNRQVKVRLLGLDSRGTQTVELEKTEPGPFGFFIAVGQCKRKKGIFVSHVSLTCLASVLSIHDQILSVDGQSLKGKTLEQCQAMISSKNKITLTTLPAIMR